MENFVEKSWSDETPGKSYIERLNFSADRCWTKVVIEVTGTTKETTYEINVEVGGKKETGFSCYDLGDGAKKVHEYNVNKQAAINITGFIKRSSLLHEAGANITVKAYYEGDVAKSVIKTWDDRTAGISVIEELGIDKNDDHEWEKCVIRVKGDQNCRTSCLLTFIVNGEEYGKEKMEDKFEIKGTSSKEFEFDINQKCSLLVAGYIANNTVVTGAGATIELEAIYKE